MVGPVGKSPRYTLTPAEKQLLLEAQRRERRIRRAEEKATRETTVPGTAQKKAAAKSSGTAKAADAKDVSGADEAAGAKETAETKEAKAKPTDTVNTSEAKAPGKKKAPAQTARVWESTLQRTGRTNAAPVPPSVVAARTDDDTVEVASTLDSIVATIAGEAPQPEAPDDPPSRAQTASLAAGSGKRKRVETAETRKRRRGLLQDESCDEDDDEPLGGDEDIAAATSVVVGCVVNGDPNLMSAGADACTGLNSDEDPDIAEEPEDEEEEDDDDNNWAGDWDIGDLTDESSDEESEELPESVWSSMAKDGKAISSMRSSGWAYDSTKFEHDPTYENLLDGPHGPRKCVLAVAEDPLALLFYYMPPKLWYQIAVESNRYHTQSIPLRARAIRSQQRRAGGEVEEFGDIQRRLSEVPDIEAWEVLRVIALLIARMLVPIRKGIAAHWSGKKVGVLPGNCFGQFMAKNRFFYIMGYLHFSNNKSPQASLDRAWKIRPVVDVLQRTFARAYRAPPVISFDEATLPSRSRYNPTRQYNKDKPHKWGRRIEVYYGAKAHLRTPVPKNNNSGEAAVLRNMNALCPPSMTSPWRLVVTDRFYTSVKLALELLHRRMYLTGTIQTDRAGYAKDAATKKEGKNGELAEGSRPRTRHVGISRKQGVSSADSVHVDGPNSSLHVFDRRKSSNRDCQNVPAPELVRDYHRWMGGVDVHDQLRMQRYSVQLAYKARKYYKTLFLGLLDMALVNAFIVHRYYRKVNNKRPPKHFAFFETLMEQLLVVDFAEAFSTIQQATTEQERTMASPVRDGAAPQRAQDGSVETDDGHRIEENPDTVGCKHGKRRVPRSCKVFAVFKVKPRKFTKYFCPECSTGNRRKYMCNVAREGQDKTCFLIWHAEWNNGNDIPRHLLQEHKVRDRPPSTLPGKKRRRRAAEAEERLALKKVTMLAA